MVSTILLLRRGCRNDSPLINVQILQPTANAYTSVCINGINSLRWHLSISALHKRLRRKR